MPLSAVSAQAEAAAAVRFRVPFSSSEPFSPRPIRPLGLRTHADWRLKAYSITYGPAPLDLPLYEKGLTLALAALPMPAVTTSRPGVGFVIFHQGRGVHYLVLNWWDNENEFFNRVFVRPFGADQKWRAAGGGESACVWDLEVIWSERQAYVRHILGPLNGPDVDGYLAATMAGAAG
jgi:hypothetical protein